jgi:hypothetical protein
MPLPDAPPGGLTVVWASAADAIEAAMSDAVMSDFNILKTPLMSSG